MGASAKKIPQTVQRDMEKVLAAAGALKEQLLQLLGEDNADAITIRDTIEGETDLFEIIDKVALQIGEDDSRAEGIAEMKKTLDARKSRLEERSANLRAMLQNALDMLGERKLERPIATISIRPVAPKLIVVDEASVPSTYWKQPEPVLARKELGEALKTRRAELEKLGELAASGDVNDAFLNEERAKIDAAHPPIPGAELDNGGATIQLRFG